MKIPRQLLQCFVDFKKGNNEQKLKVTKELEKLWDSKKSKIEDGYSAVMLSLLSRFFMELNDIAKAEHYLNEYEKIKDVIEVEKNQTEIEEDPCVLVCKAYSLSQIHDYSTKFLPQQAIIDLYVDAIR